MNRLINDCEQLHAYLPNFIPAVKGEQTLYNKVTDYLAQAEEWVADTFTGPELFGEICDMPADDHLRWLTGRLVVAEAMHRAIPALDLVYTPNGFGVVSTQNLAPASQHRVAALVESMLVMRDEAINPLLRELRKHESWRLSSQGEYFAVTLFQDLSICNSLKIPYGEQWEKYLELRPQIIDLEATLAEEWFSPELMAHLRAVLLDNSLSLYDFKLINEIEAQMIGCLQNGSFSARRLADIVNFIRNCPHAFPMWHASETAKLFNPPVFRNQKKAAGYFF